MRSAINRNERASAPEKCEYSMRAVGMHFSVQALPAAVSHELASDLMRALVSTALTTRNFLYAPSTAMVKAVIVSAWSGQLDSCAPT